MIADKVIPCSYQIELSGEAIKTFFVDDYGLNSVIIISDDFDSDIEATNKMNELVQGCLDHIGLDEKHISKSVEFNGKFYPCGEKDESEERAVTQADVDLMSEQYAEEGKIPVVLSNVFDSDGDFIQSRWTFISSNFSIVGKIGADMDKYMWFLGVDQLTRHETIDRSSLKTNITVH